MLRHPPGRPSRLALAVGGGLLTLTVLLHLPALTALVNGWEVKRNTTDAVAALREGDLAGAREHAAAARGDALDIDRIASGVSGTIWSWLPEGEDDRRDMRHLADAMLDVTSVIETAAEAHPREASPDGFIIDAEGKIDVEALAAVLGELDTISSHAASAVEDLEQVGAKGFLLGSAIDSTRDEALSTMRPVARTIELVRPLIPLLPELLGGEEPQSYLIALLNPAEQRFSGGATLTFAPLVIREGQVVRGEPLAAVGGARGFEETRWVPVTGNPFHPVGKEVRLTTAALAPSWPVSGEELLRGWEAVRHESMDALVALDVVALQDLMRFTGPIDVPGYGTLDASNLTERLIGSYDELVTPDVFNERRVGNQVLVDVFQSRALNGRNILDKISSLLLSAKARHFAVYHRDPRIQDAIDETGLAGDLADSPYDYIGVFNQALTGHKADYWQRRTVKSRVTLDEDGSANVRLRVRVFNASPPPATDVHPVYKNYVRRDNRLALGAFLPTNVSQVTARVDGARRHVALNEYFGRPYIRTRMNLAPREKRVLVLDYHVPQAAVRHSGGRLAYRLDIDPQGLVDPQAMQVTVHWPKGFEITYLPAVWSSDRAGRAQFSTRDMTYSSSWTVVGTNDDGW